jgi:4-hydroxybutyryl-CoA dehydratase/vinylacetyl-CoA-Delta-isomerase
VRDASSTTGISNYFLHFCSPMVGNTGFSFASHLSDEIYMCGFDVGFHIIRYKETLRATAIAAAHLCRVDEETGIAVPDVVMTNVGKLLANEEYVNAVKHLVDVAGGLTATAPTMQDYENPQLRRYLEKYLAGAKGTALERLRLFMLARELISSFGALFTTAMIHAEGSIEASVIELYRSYDYSQSKDLALYAAGLKESLD